MMQNLGFDENQAIRSKTFTKALSSAQARVEGNNFDIRKQLLQYDDVMNNQREIMYGRRNEILDSESIHSTVLDTIKNHVSDLVNSHICESVLPSGPTFWLGGSLPISRTSSSPAIQF